MRRTLPLDHRVLGTGYILLAILAGLMSAVLSLCLRLPGARLSLMLRPEAGWHLVATLHGPMLIAFSAIPALLGGYGNWLVPLMIGADDTAFPRLGLASLGLTTLGLAATTAGLLCGGSVPWLLAALYLAGLGLLLCSANLVVTLLNLRAAGTGLGAMPVFAWSQLIAACLAIVAVPVLVAAATLAGLHRLPATPDAARMVGALAYPGFCVMILPALGLVSEIVSTLSGRVLVGRRSAVAALASLATLGFLAWAHPVLQNGPRVLALGPGRDVVTLQGLFVAVPVLWVIGCWGMTLLRAGARPRLRTAPALFSAGVVAVLLVGSLARPLHDVLSLATGFAMFAGFYHWIGRISLRRYPEQLAQLQFWLLLSGVALIFVPLAAAAVLVPLGAALISLSMLLFALIAGITALRRPTLAAGAWLTTALSEPATQPGPGA